MRSLVPRRCLTQQPTICQYRNRYNTPENCGKKAAPTTRQRQNTSPESSNSRRSQSSCSSEEIAEIQEYIRSNPKMADLLGIADLLESC